MLRDFRTVYIVSQSPQFFNTEDLRHELQNHPDFAPLRVEIVDELAAADVLLEVDHVFPGDFPFEVKFRETGAVLLSNQGTGPLPGKAGAARVAGEFIKAIEP